MNNFGLFRALGNFRAFQYILCSLGIFWVYFPPFWYVVPRKIWYKLGSTILLSIPF
jgi:hypothetical protein